MKFTIDRATWRNGGHGVGPTRLLNEMGYQCCLGFVEEQLGLERAQIDGKATPEELDVSNMLARVVALESGGVMRMRQAIALDAIVLNDATNLSDAEREWRLQSLFQIYGHELEFVGEYSDRSPLG